MVMHVKVATMADADDLPPDEDFDDGWDMSARLVEGRWVDRSPRRSEVEPQVRREVALMPWLAPRLPLPVPVARVVSEDPLTVRHALIVGEACDGSVGAHGRAVGGFLRALHGVDPDEAVAHGARDADASFAEAQRIRDRMATEVVPLLPARLRSRGEALLARLSVPRSSPRLVHGDLGPQHILVVGDEVTGVIDWGDCGLGDPALDLAWTRYGAGPAFARALEAAYAPDEDVLARGLDHHLLGPWHEVIYGLDTEQPGYVESGLEGAVRRLVSSGRGG
jgi:aminoglycoside phosphotransferase (APT) family kinase protein